MQRIAAPVVLWIAVLVLLGSGAVTGAALVRDAAFGPEPRPRASDGRPGPPPRSGPLAIAGSGSNLPITRALAEALEAQGGPRGVVHESIGSTGGVRAAYDGAVDVGLISRPLREDERALGLVVVPYASVAVVLATHPRVVDRSLSRRAVLDVYAGRRRAWSDGRAIVPLLRERGDSSLGALAERMPGFGPVIEAATRERRWRVLHHDREMQEAIAATDGAVGPLDLGAIVAQRLSLRVLAIDGVPPNDPRYPFRKELALVHRRDARPEVHAFVRWFRSPEARARLAASGYTPAGTP